MTHDFVTSTGFNIELQQFYDALKSAVVTNSFLELEGHNVTFLSKTNLPSKLYVRQAYIDLHELIHRTYSDRQALIIGNPGIGKSFFCLYELYRLLKKLIDEKNGGWVVYDNIPLGLFMILSADRIVYSGDRRCVSNAELGTNSYYLYDAGTKRNKSPFIMGAKTIVFSLLAKQNYCDYVKTYEIGHKLVSLYMPIWNLDEINAITHMYHNPNPIKQFEIWGGVPRKVFSDAKPDKMDRAIASCNLEEVSKVFNFTSTGDFSHCLLHLTVDPADYTTASVRFASQYVKDKYCESYEDHSHSLLARLLEIRPVSLRNVEFGRLFELFAYRCISCGGTFPVRSLEVEEGVCQTISLPSEMRVVQFHSVDDLDKFKQSTDSIFFIPMSKTFASFDYLCICDGRKIGFQMTVGSSHPIQEEMLKSCMEALDAMDDFEFYFVVPENVYPEFKKQMYVSTKGKKTALEQNYCVHQYALNVDLTSFKKRYFQ